MLEEIKRFAKLHSGQLVTRKQLFLTVICLLLLDLI